MGLQRRRGWLAAGLAAVAVAACSGGDKERARPSPTTNPTTSTTGPVVTGPGNPRVTTTLPVDLQGGGATLAGLVLGPAGPVDGAVVRAERFVGDAVATVDVPAVAGGRWELTGIRGGRYRLRAWRAPDFAQLQPFVLFLQATEAKTVDLQVAAFGAVTAEGTMTPTSPQVGQPATLTVVVSSSQVGPDGVVRVTPSPGVSVQLALSGGLVLLSPVIQVTDGSGRASWQLQCREAGAFPVAVIVGTSTVPVNVPPCGGAPPTTRG